MATPPVSAISTDVGQPAITGTGAGTGVLGQSENGPGVSAESHHFDACIANCHSATNSALAAVNDAGGFGVRGLGKRGVVGESADPDGIGIFGKGGRLAGFFEGHVQVTGDFRGAHVFADKIDCASDANCAGTVHCFDVSIANADCAEEFELASAEAVEPGTLMSFGIDGSLFPSSEAYDSKVVGVISGAGDYKPGIVLDRRRGGNRVPIALLGKVYCKVDTEYSAIEVGDLLTTSPTAGHALPIPVRHSGPWSVRPCVLKAKGEV
jgi:hypothetical protein